MLTSAANVHLTFPDVYVSPDSPRKKPILLNGSSIHSIDFSTILQKLKAACILWRSCIRLVLVSTSGSREQRSSSFSCETTKTINPVSKSNRKHTATLCSTALLHLIFQSSPRRRELDPVRVRVNACGVIKISKTYILPFSTFGPIRINGDWAN